MTHIVFDVTAEADPFGPALHRLTQARGKFFRLDWRGSGSGGLTMNLSRSEAQYLKKNRGIRVWDLDLSTTIPLGWWVLTKRSSRILTKDGRGGREVTWTGPGLLGFLGRARMDSVSHVDQGPLEGDGTWRLHLQGSPHGGKKLGAMYNRGCDECMHPTRPRQPLAAVVKDFNGFTDSNGLAWTGYEGEVVETIGTPLSEVTNHFMDLGLDIDAREDLVAKKMLLRAYRSPQGADRTGPAWAAGVVRFQRQTDGTLATTNIKDEMVSTGDAELEVSDLLVGSSDGYSWVDNPAAGVEREGFLGSEGSTNTARDSAGEANIAARGRASDTIKLNVRHGNDPANGLYRFGPRWIPGVHAAPGDLTTLNTGIDEGDYNETDQVIASITWTDRPTGPGQDIHVEFGASYRSSAEREFRARLTQLVSWKTHTHPPNPRICRAIACTDLNDAHLVTATATNGDVEAGAAGWSGGSVTTTKRHAGAQSYQATGVTSADFIYDFGSQVFQAGVRYVLDIWRRQTTDHNSTTITFGDEGGDEDATTYAGVAGTDPPGLWDEDATGADGQEWNRGRVCWTPSANRTNVRVRFQVSAFASGDFAVDDLALYTTSSALKGTSVEASACDHGHYAREIVFLNGGTDLASTNVQDLGVELAERIAAVGTGPGATSHDDLTERENRAGHTWALAAFGGEEHQVNVIAPAGPTPTLDLSLGNVQDITLDQAATISFSNPGAAGVERRWLIKLRGQFAVSWSAPVTFILGPAPEPATDGFAYHEIVVATDDGGTTFRAYNIAGAIAEGAASVDRVWMPLTTVVAGVPELVWDDDDSLIPTEVPI